MSDYENDRSLALWFTPQAIRDHWDGAEDVPTGLDKLTDDELAEAGGMALQDDGLYEQFHRTLTWAVEQIVAAKAAGTKPLMECGHAPQGQNSNGAPVCIVCFGSGPGATTVAPPPDLTGRKARCSYDNGRGHDGHNGCRPQPQPVDSSTSLPFFKHQPDKPEDSYYCGCWGWD